MTSSCAIDRAFSAMDHARITEGRFQKSWAFFHKKRRGAAETAEAPLHPP